MKITFNVTPLEELGERIGKMTPEALGAFTVEALNSTVDRAYDLSRAAMLRGINLTDAYIQRSMKVEHATPRKPEASIVTFGGRGHITNLSHYGAMQMTGAVNWSNERILAEQGKFAAWPGWTRRKGNLALGIAPDQKAVGKSVEVVRGRRKPMKPVFSIPGKRDKDGNLILFSRNAADKIEAKTGPSPYQLFRTAIPLIRDDVTEDLQQAVVDVATREFQKALTP